VARQVVVVEAGEPNRNSTGRNEYVDSRVAAGASYKREVLATARREGGRRRSSVWQGEWRRPRMYRKSAR